MRVALLLYVIHGITTPRITYIIPSFDRILEKVLFSTIHIGSEQEDRADGRAHSHHSSPLSKRQRTQVSILVSRRFVATLSYRPHIFISTWDKMGLDPNPTHHMVSQNPSNNSIPERVNEKKKEREHQTSPAKRLITNYFSGACDAWFSSSSCLIGR